MHRPQSHCGGCTGLELPEAGRSRLTEAQGQDQLSLEERHTLDHRAQREETEKPRRWSENTLDPTILGKSKTPLTSEP